MPDSIFNPEVQNRDLTSKVVVGLERISEAFRVLLWEHAKTKGISPIQIQLLLFIQYHPSQLCNVSHLAHEFNLTKATISDAVRVLVKKGLLEKEVSIQDKRAFHLVTTAEGREMIANTESFAKPIHNAFAKLSMVEQESAFGALSKVIHLLNKAGILTVQRSCQSCRFFQKSGSKAYCGLLEKPLAIQDLRLDCPEFESKEI